MQSIDRVTSSLSQSAQQEQTARPSTPAADRLLGALTGGIGAIVAPCAFGMGALYTLGAAAGHVTRAITEELEPDRDNNDAIIWHLSSATKMLFYTAAAGGAAVMALIASPLTILGGVIAGASLSSRQPFALLKGDLRYLREDIYR